MKHDEKDDKYTQRKYEGFINANKTGNNNPNTEEDMTIEGIIIKRRCEKLDSETKKNF